VVLSARRRDVRGAGLEYPFSLDAEPLSRCTDCRRCPDEGPQLLWAARLRTPQASVRGDVGITQHVSLKLQVAQTVLDYITDADETGELAIA